MKFPEKYKVVPVLSDLDLTDAAAMSGDSLNMKGYHRATFIINFQDLGVEAIYVLLYSGVADGDKTSALRFEYAFGSAAAGAANCDVLEATATSANLTVAHATKDNFMLIVEIDATSMDVANQEGWLTLVFADSDTGATGNVSVHAILEPRYTKYLSATALT